MRNCQVFVFTFLVFQSLLWQGPLWADSKDFLGGSPQSLKEFSQFSDSIKELIYAEQYLTDLDKDPKGRVAESEFVEGAYAPTHHRILEIKGYWLPEDKLDVFDLPPADGQRRFKFRRVHDGRSEVLYLVHPQSQNAFSELIKEADGEVLFRAVVTASNRTVLAWPEGHPESPFFAKLSLDAVVGGANRLIPATEVARSIGVAAALRSIRQDLPSDFVNLDETLGVMPHGMARGGMIIRDIPEDLLEGSMRMIPLFSIYSNGPQGHTPLLAQWIRASGMDSRTYVTTKIIRPFVNQWINLISKFGIATEPHGQNVLLELDHEDKPTGTFIHRDLAGFNLDFNFLKARGYQVPKNLPFYTSFEKTYFTDKHQKNIGLSMSTYFIAAVAQPLGQRLETWYSRGFLPRENFGASEVENVVRDELEIALSGRLDSSVQFQKDLKLTDIEKDVHKIRSQILKRDSLMHSCVDLLRKLAG